MKCKDARARCDHAAYILIHEAIYIGSMVARASLHFMGSVRISLQSHIGGCRHFERRCPPISRDTFILGPSIILCFPPFFFYNPLEIQNTNQLQLASGTKLFTH